MQCIAALPRDDTTDDTEDTDEIINVLSGR